MDKKKSIKIKVKRALAALRQTNNHFNDSSKKSLFNNGEQKALYLHLSLKKIPSFKNIKMIRVPLPNSLINDTSEICLITGDLDKNDRKAEIEPTILKYKSFLKEHNITNIEILPLRQLRTEYKTHESKRYLMNAYDKFLADKKIAACLPQLLGKHFFKKRKFPVNIDLNNGNLYYHINSKLSSTVFYVKSHGNFCGTQIAHLGMEDKQIMQNIIQCLKSLKKHLPGGWKNILGMYLRTVKSPSIPIYLSYDNFNNIKLNDEPKHEIIEAEEISTLTNKKVKILPDCSIQVIKVKIDNDLEEDGKDIKNNSNSLIKKEIISDNFNNIKLKDESKHKIIEVEDGNINTDSEEDEEDIENIYKSLLKKKISDDENSSDDQIHDETFESKSMQWKKAKSAEFKKDAINKKKLKLNIKNDENENSSDNQIHDETFESQSMQWKKAKSAEFKKEAINKKKFKLNNKNDDEMDQNSSIILKKKRTKAIKNDPDVYASGDNENESKKKKYIKKEILNTPDQKENRALKKKINTFKDYTKIGLSYDDSHEPKEISSNQKKLKAIKQKGITLKKERNEVIKNDADKHIYGSEHEPEKKVPLMKKKLNTSNKKENKTLKKKINAFKDNDSYKLELENPVSSKQKDFKMLDQQENTLKKKKLKACEDNYYSEELEKQVSKKPKNVKAITPKEKILKMKKIKTFNDNYYSEEPEKQFSKKQKNVKAIPQKENILKKKNIKTFNDNEVNDDNTLKEHVSLKQENIKAFHEKEKSLKKKNNFKNKSNLDKKHKLDGSDLRPQKKKKVLSSEHDEILKQHKIDEHLQMGKKRLNQNKQKKKISLTFNLEI